MKQQEERTLHDLEERYQNALQDTISEQEVQQFRQVFEHAWVKRSLWNRVFGKPLNAGLLAIVIVFAGLGSGYSLMNRTVKTKTSERPDPILTPGQRIVDDPELMALFPKVNHPTLISSEPDNKPDESKYLVHGYLENDIQVVWEY